jgi:hypothetical protein
MAKPLSNIPGVIEPGRLYLAEEARRRLRLGDWSWRRMRRDGLPVIYYGQRAFIFGDDLLDYFKRKKK